MAIWSPDEEALIKSKYSSLTVIEIANLLERTQSSVKSKVDKMVSRGLIPKKDKLKSQIYGSNSKANGRQKAKILKILKESFSLDDNIKIKRKISTRQSEIIEGQIIQKTDSMIVVKTDNYTSSFKYIDFYTKSCIVI